MFVGFYLLPRPRPRGPDVDIKFYSETGKKDEIRLKKNIEIIIVRKCRLAER
jgi:hypothetical protein